MSFIDLPMETIKTHKLRMSDGIKVVLSILLLAALVMVAWGLWQGVTKIHKNVAQRHSQNLHQYQLEVDNSVERLSNIVTTLLSSQTLRARITKITEISPYFVFTPDSYGVDVDYWDRVRMVEHQIWMLQSFLPTIQSNEWDYVGLYFLDPHTNSPPSRPLPFLEINKDQTTVYTYSPKGNVKEALRFSGDSAALLQMEKQYFDRAIYSPQMGTDLYLLMGLTGTRTSLDEIHSPAISSFERVQISHSLENVHLRMQRTIELTTYNWKSQQRENTSVMMMIAEKKLSSFDLKEFKRRIGGDDLAIVINGQVIASSFDPPITELPGDMTNGLHGVAPQDTTEVEINGSSYLVYQSEYQHTALEGTFQLVVFGEQAHLQQELTAYYTTVLISVALVILLLIPFLLYLNRRPSVEQAASVPVPADPPSEPLASQSEIHKPDEEYMIMEEEGKSLTIHPDQVSHIKVTDHYCTIVYRADEVWKSCMLLDSLKSFEERYPGRFLSINRSTLINPHWIEKIQLHQRKIIMEGDSETTFTISQSRVENLKEHLSPSNSLSD